MYSSLRTPDDKVAVDRSQSWEQDLGWTAVRLSSPDRHLQQLRAQDGLLLSSMSPWSIVSWKPSSMSFGCFSEFGISAHKNTLARMSTWTPVSTARHHAVQAAPSSTDGTRTRYRPCSAICAWKRVGATSTAVLLYFCRRLLMKVIQRGTTALHGQGDAQLVFTKDCHSAA